jgi:hypothetical protein
MAQVPVIMPVPRSVQLAVADIASNVASTLLPELAIAVLVAAVHVVESPEHDMLQPGSPVPPDVMRSRLPDSWVLQGRLTDASLGLAHEPEIVVTLEHLNVSIVSAPPGLTVPVPEQLPRILNGPPMPPPCETSTTVVNVIATDVVTFLPSTCQTVNAEAEAVPMEATVTSTDKTARLKFFVMRIWRPSCPRSRVKRHTALRFA